MEAITAKTPWAPFMVDVPMHLNYFEGSMFDKVAWIAGQYPNNVAFDFMGRPTTYRELVREIEKCAKALKTIGIREHDRVTISMPNSPLFEPTRRFSSAMPLSSPMTETGRRPVMWISGPSECVQ